jgi:mono/diheme cytochrome c family protein
MTRPEDDPTSDVEVMHRRPGRRGPFHREAPEPREGEEPTPWWVWALIVVSLFVGGFYLGRHGGRFSSDVHDGWLPPPTGTPARPELAKPATGKELYESRCANCHQADARGLAGTYPPLIGAQYVVGPPEITVRIVLLGLTGELAVAGQTYRGDMPSWRALMKDEEIAKVISYLREQSGVTPIDAELVARVRTETAQATSPMPASELRSIVGER